MNNTLKIALQYAQKMKWSVVPAKVGPIVDGKASKFFPVQWGEFQDRIATEKEITDWYTKNPNWGIAIICGKTSNLVVLDVDDTKIDLSKYNLPETLTVKTGRGYHRYFRLPKGLEIYGKTDIEKGVELKGEKTTVHAPPTLYSGEIRYRWFNQKGVKLAELPESLIERYKELKGNKKSENKDWSLIAEGVSDGMRNHTAASFTGKILGTVNPKEWESLAWPVIQMWNRQNNPPLEEKVLRATFESIAKRQFGNVSEEVSEQLEDSVILAEDKKNQIEELKKQTPHFLARSNIASLEDTVDGFRKGQLIIVSGPPKAGKTQFCQTLTKHFTQDEKKCLWFSYELGYDELFAKFPMTNLDFYVPNYIQTGNLDWIEEKVKESKEKFGTDIVFIDHLDFLRDPSELRGRNVSQNMSSYVGGLVQRVKSMARSQNVVIFLMCHIRKNEWTAKDVPTSAELRDSGQIAQLADIVMMVMRKRKRGSNVDEMYDGNFATLGVIENRHNGKTKKIPMELKDNEFVESYFPKSGEVETKDLF